MILLFMIFIFILIYFEYKRTSILFSFYNLFLIYWFLYTVGIFLYGAKINNNIIFATYLILLAGIFFIIGYNIIPLGLKRIRQHKIIKKYRLPNLTFPLIILLGISISFFVYVVVVKIGIQEYFFTSRANRSLIIRPYSSLMIFIDLFNFISVLSLFLFLNTKKIQYKRVFILAFTFAITHAVMTISRNNLVLILIPTIYLFHYYNYIKAKSIVIILSIGITISIIWKVLLYNLIIANSFDLSTIFENIKFPREFIVWQEIGENILNNNITLYGKSYIDAFINLIYPFAHIDNLSLWYVKNYEPHTYAIGGGRGFSNVLEAYINFDIAGVILFFFLFGILIYLFQRKSINSPYIFLSYAFSLAFIHRIFRSDFMSLTKTWWWMYFISFLLLFAVIKLLPKKRLNETIIYN